MRGERHREKSEREMIAHVAAAVAAADVADNDSSPLHVLHLIACSP